MRDDELPTPEECAGYLDDLITDGELLLDFSQIHETLVIVLRDHLPEDLVATIMRDIDKIGGLFQGQVY